MSFILTLTGPSCAGKTTLERKLKEVGFEPVISTTTRPIREGEINGENYYYVTREEFAELIGHDRLIEHIEFGGNCYGISREEIQRVFDNHKPIVIVVEPQGLKQIKEYSKKMGWEVYSVFVDNPPKVIAGRFLKRFIDDVKNATNENDIYKVYTSRLADIMTIEAAWRVEAYNSRSDLYSVVIDAFDETNDRQIVAEFMKLILDVRHKSLIA